MSNELAHQLYDELAQMPCINSHSHLLSEAERLEQDVDALVMFGHAYPRADLRSAGMPEETAQLALSPGLSLAERWQLFGSLGLLDASFDEFQTPERDLAGRDQAHAPGYQLALGAEYRSPAGWFARLDGFAQDGFYFSDSHDQRAGSHQLLHLKLGYEISGIIGMNPSPSCGVEVSKGKGTMLGLDRDTSEIEEPGVFIEEMMRLAEQRSLQDLPFFGIRRILPGEEGIESRIEFLESNLSHTSSDT